MYKDKQKQQEAQRLAQQRYRDKKSITLEVIPVIPVKVIPKQPFTHPLNLNPQQLIPNHLLQYAEQCQYCGEPLPKLSKPRKYPGACYECALKQPAKPVSPANEGHILASRPALEFTGKLTAFERKHYKPASELKPGELNPVSKLGDEHYGIY